MTMLAEVKAILTIDHGELETCVPPDPTDFCVAVRAIVGPRNQEGEESFDVKVCTPAWINRFCQERGAVLGRHYLIVSAYNPALIRSVLTKQIERCSGSSWGDIAAKLRQIGHWEFEDYRPSD